MQGYQDSDLSIDVQIESDCIRLTWRGRSSARNPGDALDPFFGDVKNYAESGPTPVIMDFTDLEHFNSSTISVLIQCIQDFREPAIPLIMHYNPSARWQRVSFDALKIFIRDDLLRIEPLKNEEAA